jgi:hypothetical protein
MARKKQTSVVVVEAKMNDNLQIVFDREVVARSSMIRDNLRFHRERGKVISRVRAGKSLDGKSNVDYGDKPVESLSDKLGISCSYVYKLATFYEIYADNDKFQELMDKFEDNQFNLSWSHFNCLVHVTDNDLREQLIDEAVEKKLSVRKLHDLLEDNKIEIPDEYFEEGISDSDLIKEQPVITVEPKFEEEVSEKAESKPDVDFGSIDSEVSVGSPKSILKKLVNTSANYGSKLIDLVGDLTIAISGVHGTSANKDVFKGLSSSLEVLDSLKHQIGEYHEQVERIQSRLLSERKKDDSE